MPSELDLIRSLYEYNSRLRTKYLAAIWKLPSKELHQDRGASFPSLVDIYMHVLDAYRFWFLGVYGNDVPFEEYPLGRRYTKAEALQETRTVDRVVQSVLGTLTTKELDRVLRVPRRPQETLTVRTMLVHMIEEELQHRGEMNALLWQAGREPPVLGYGD